MKGTYDSKWLVNENGELLGIDLGADFCSEHEWGIKGIQWQFQIPFEEEKVFGIEKRTIRTLPENLAFCQFKKVHNKKQKTHYLLILENPRSFHQDNPKETLPYGLSNLREDTQMTCAWDESSFAILTLKEHKDKLEQLVQAFRNKDIAIGLGMGHAFKNCGLVITIASRMSETAKKGLYEQDVDYHLLQLAAQKTGIHNKLKKAKKGYYALSPRWKDEEKQEVVFWLNPMEQSSNNYGLYSVEELELWTKNKGPIPKSGKGK